jgi:hypothetical protein
MVTTTRQPYAYVSDNPLNLQDPSGLWPWDDVVNAAHSAYHWATTAVDFPNSDFVAGYINVGYGVTKVGLGLIDLVSGTILDATGIGAVLGVPDQAVGLYNIGSGYFRAYRGIKQCQNAINHPVVHQSSVDWATDTGTGLAPGGGAIENRLGGLP